MAPRQAASGKDAEAARAGRAEPATARRARKDRGAETRARLIEAALDLFGRRGFEGAATREIARAADANLAAIVYHFGSKEALYRAVAEHVVAEIGGALGPRLAAAEATLGRLDAAGARAVLVGLLSAYVDVVLGSPMAERWARFIIREQMEPTAAFDILYGLFGGAHQLATRLVAIATEADPEALETKLRTFALIGQGLIFRLAPAFVLRRLGHSSLGAADREAIKHVIAAHALAILSPGDPP